MIFFFSETSATIHFSVSSIVPLRDILNYYFGFSPWHYMTDGVVVLIPPGQPSVGCVETSTLSRGSWWFIWAMWQLAWWSICGNPQREGWGHLMGWGIAQGLNSNILWQDLLWTPPTSGFAFGFFGSKLPLDQQIPLKKYILCWYVPTLIFLQVFQRADNAVCWQGSGTHVDGRPKITQTTPMPES